MNLKSRRVSGAAAMSVVISHNKPWQLSEIRLHLGAGGAASDLTVTIDSSSGSAFDTVLYTKAMSGVTDVDYRWNPEPRFTHKNDKVIIAYANAGAATWGLEVIYEPLGG